MEHSYLGQAVGIGQVSAYAGQSTASQPKQRGVDHLLECITKRLAHIEMVSCRVNGIADRLHGPVPESVGNEKGQIQAIPTSLTARLSALDERLVRIGSALEAEVARIEDFI